MPRLCGVVAFTPRVAWPRRAWRGGVGELLHPGDPSGRTRLVVRGPRVRRVTIVGLDPEREPARLTVELAAEGWRYLEDRDSAAVLSGSRSRMIRFTERWTLALDGSDEQPWRLVGAHPALTSRRARKVTGRASR